MPLKTGQKKSMTIPRPNEPEFTPSGTPKTARRDGFEITAYWLSHSAPALIPTHALNKGFNGEMGCSRTRWRTHADMAVINWVFKLRPFSRHR